MPRPATPPATIVGKILVYLNDRKGRTISELSDRLGINHSNLSRVLAGRPLSPKLMRLLLTKSGFDLAERLALVRGHLYDELSRFGIQQFTHRIALRELKAEQRNRDLDELLRLPEAQAELTVIEDQIREIFREAWAHAKP